MDDPCIMDDAMNARTFRTSRWMLAWAGLDVPAGM
jgi:hypothetical protein